MTDIKVRTTITVKKELELTEDQIEAILQAHGALRFACDADNVSVHFDVSSGGFLRSATLSTEIESVEE